MSKGLEALGKIGSEPIICGNIIGSVYNKYKIQFDIIEKELEALEIIKDFVWIENGEIHLGLYGDSEIVLKENDFKSKQEFDLLKEVLL